MPTITRHSLFCTTVQCSKKTFLADIKRTVPVTYCNQFGYQVISFNRSSSEYFLYLNSKKQYALSLKLPKDKLNRRPYTFIRPKSKITQEKSPQTNHYSSQRSIERLQTTILTPPVRHNYDPLYDDYNEETEAAPDITYDCFNEAPTHNQDTSYEALISPNDILPVYLISSFVQSDLYQPATDFVNYYPVTELSII